MRLYALLACATLLLGSTPAWAVKVYKWTDEQGNVVYSDKPRPGAIEMEVPTEPAGIAPVPPEKMPPRPATGTAASGYGALIIVSPANDAVLDDPSGQVNVSLILEPALKVDQGDAIRLRLDARELSERYTDSEIALANVERGKHIVQAEVVNRAGRALITSAPVTFVQQRPSERAPAGPPTYEPVYPPQPYPPTYTPVYPPQPYPPQGKPKPNAPPN